MAILPESTRRAAIEWLESRTGLIGLWNRWNADLPGGPRWSYAIGSLVGFNFALLVLTGVLLGFGYSPSTQTAWESVHYLQYETIAGGLIRGVHHFAAHGLLIVLGVHFFTLLVTRSYTLPQEVSFWVWFIAAQVLVVTFLTGFLLPWDQYGYHGSVARNKILGATPVIGQPTLAIVQGGSTFGHLTLTRFYALHAFVFPVIGAALLWVYSLLRRRARRLVAEQQATLGDPSPVYHYWPQQAFRDGLLWAMLLVVVVAITLVKGAPLWGPANTVDSFGAARPEPEFFFLFRFLKLEALMRHGTALGAVYIPGAISTVVLLMPLIARWKFGHSFNLAFVMLIALGMCWLSWLAVSEDAVDQEYQAAFKEAEREAARAIELVRHDHVSPLGALSLAQNDPLFQGPKLFARHCAGCHHFDGHNGLGAPVLHVTLGPNHTKSFAPEPAVAPDLGRFGSREWTRQVLVDFATVFAPVAGLKVGEKSGTRLLEGDMASWSKENAALLNDPANAKDVDALLEFLLAQSARPGQTIDTALAQQGRIVFEKGTLTSGNLSTACADCHALHAVGEAEPLSTASGTGAPTLTGYGGVTWIRDFVQNPAHEQFYGEEGNLMPAFAGKLSSDELVLIGRWITGDYWVPDPGK